MTPILYAASETAFTSNGIGRLTDCISCTVTEERNGIYECAFEYPINGRHYADIAEGCYIACTHDDDGDIQPFEIYRRSAPLNGIVTFNARHLSYKLSHVILNPFVATDVQTALSKLTSENINTNPFTFWSDKTTAAPFRLDAPSSVRGIMGGTEGSILDVFGGEWDFDKWTVKLYAHRGNASGVTIRYAKNLTGLEQVIDAGGVYSAVVPYWFRESEDGDTLIMLPERIVTAQGVTDPQPVVLDLSMELQEEPTEAQLRAAASAHLIEQAPEVPEENITVNFVQLWQTTEYQGIANLQKVRLCDTVDVIYTALGVTAYGIKVIKTVYNVLAERYDSIELGSPRASFAQVVSADTQKQVTQAQEQMQGFFDSAIQTATDLLTGGNGGHVVIKRDANGTPQEILILDTESELTATNILRINLNGIGFSTDGGTTYATAWTISGAFVADFITAGKLRAIKIQGPRNTDAATSDPENVQFPTFWDLATGMLQSYGKKQVTSNISGTTSQYNVETKTRVYSGEFSVTGKKEGDAEDTVFSDVGILANSNYSYYGELPVPFLAGIRQSIDVTYPRGEMDLRGHKVAFPCGAGTTEEGTIGEEPGKGQPVAKYSTDKITLGTFEDYALDNGTSIGNYMPARNSLSIAAGWNSYKDSIIFTKRYNAYDTLGGEVYKEYFTPPVQHRAAWDIAPGDEWEIERAYLMGCLTNGKKDILFDIPLARPLSDDVIAVTITGTCHARQGSTVLINMGSIDTDRSLGLPYPTEIVFNANNSISVKLRNPSANGWSSGTLYSPVFLTLTELVIKAYNYDPYEEGDPDA